MQINSIFEKGTGAINEDFYCISGNLFGVFDGATSLTDTVYEDGVTGGFLASNIAGKTFANNNASLASLAEKANQAIADAMAEREVNLYQRENIWCTSAAVVRVHKELFEWVQTGDCLILVIFEDGTHEVLIKGFDHDLETFQLWKKFADTSHNPIMSEMAEQIKRVRSQMNVTYGVLNGEQCALDFLNHGGKSLQGIKNILLFTDGLFIPHRDPKEKEDFKLFAQLFRKGGLANVKNYIREVEETDGECRIYPRFKVHDDIAAIALTF
ncbi:protein phosphatase 2C domain-containing protein [bacterium]|nr:protein phosphatase 2C domain-containing protein [bacterium]